MAPLTMLIAVLTACAAQGAPAHQHLVLFAPSEWDKVTSLEFRIDHDGATGYSPNSGDWVTAVSDLDEGAFAYVLAVEPSDRVSLKVKVEGRVREDVLVIGDVRSEGKAGLTHQWSVGPVPLYSQLENVRHADVWRTFIKKVRDGPYQNLGEHMSQMVNEADKEHQGWQVLVMMDHIPASRVGLAFTTATGRTQKTSKSVTNGGVFAAWSLDSIGGDLELAFDGGQKIDMQIQTASFRKSSFTPQSGVEASVYILPFHSPEGMDTAWRAVMEDHGSEDGAQRYWDSAALSWRGDALQLLAEEVAGGSTVEVAARADTPDDWKAADAPEVVVGGHAKFSIGLAGAVAVLLVAGYYFYCAFPSKERPAHSTELASSLESSRGQGPNVCGDSWPQESVRGPVQPAAASTEV